MVGRVDFDDRSIGTPAKSGGHRRWLTPVIAMAALVLAGYLLTRTIGRYSLDELTAAVTGFPPQRLALAGAFAAASYLCLTGFDFLALRHIGKPLPYRQSALASFTALSLGHNIGLAALSSGAVRYRFYARWGLSLAEVAQLILFCGITVGLGLLVLGGAAMLARPGLVAEMTGMGRPAVLAIAAACLSVAAGYLALAAWRRAPIRLRGHAVRVPSLHLALAQIGIGTLNFACVAGCLHQALAAVADVGYLQTASVYVIANVTALISHVPGGLGVIESVVMHLVPNDNAGGSRTIGALLVFRLVYFLVPLVLGGLLFAATELYYRGASRASSAAE